MSENGRTSWESTSHDDAPKTGCSTLLLFLIAAVVVAAVCMLLSGGFWLFDV